MSSAAFDVTSKSQFIRAGAGAGKTTKLIKTFLEFVNEFKVKNKRYPRVVMTTFTRKATQEVKERLLVSALEANEKEVFEYINKKSSVHISTIHGLLSIFLSQFAERMKFPQEIKIVDGAGYERALKRQINDLLKKNPQFLDLMEHYSFVQLVDLSVKVLDFKAQSKNFSYISREELKNLAKKKQLEIISSIDKVFSLVTAVPAKWDEYFAYLNNISLLLKAGKEQEFFEMIENEPTKPRWSGDKPSFEPIAHGYIEDLRKTLKNPFALDSYIEKHEVINKLFYEYTNLLFDVMMSYKRNTGELTISDLENLSLQLLEDHPDAAVDFSSTWDYFMIDEYQDTSPLQVKLLNKIIQDKPCFVVGDPQQSIYLFRGARSEVFEEKQAEMLSKNAEIQFLETNYRSEPSLMKFINEYFANFSKQFKPMITKEKSEKKFIGLADAYFIKSEDQPSSVLSHIQHLVSKGVNPQDICVLSRSNSKLIEIAIQANKYSVPVQLQAAAGFEAKREILDLIAFNKFLNNPHDDENLVTLIRSPWAYMSDQSLLDLAQSSKAKQQSLWSALINSEYPEKNKLIKFLDLFDVIGALQTTKQFLTETSFVSFSAFYDKTGKREANIFKFLISLANAEKAQGFSLGLFLDEQFQSLQSDLGSGNSEAQPVIQPNCVSLMTVHASKGLQFKHVIVIGFADSPQLSKTPKITFDDVSQKFSLSVLDDVTSMHESSDWTSLIKEKFNERELLENERVLYVAMTRAIESLSLVAEIGKREPSEKSWYQRSRWPIELGESVTDDYVVQSVSYEDAPPLVAPASLIHIKAKEPFNQNVTKTAATNSVTDLLSSSKAIAQAYNFEASLGHLKKAQKGSDLHRIFESMKYLSTESLMESLSEAEQALVKYLLTQKEIDLNQILTKGYNEWGFGLKTKSKFIQGQIDLWAELENEIHVSDYKTGSPAYSDKAFEQLSFYTMALFTMKMIPLDKKIVHSVIYPMDKVVKIKTYENQAYFYKKINPDILEIF
ncbi:MAG: UvrD-helicase domain-containing protein [Pseudobdellovibrio sp.]